VITALQKIIMKTLQPASIALFAQEY